MLVLCSYDYTPAELIDSKEIYGQSYGMIWLCRKCGAYVGTHKTDNSPLGTLANHELRRWRSLAHTVFDPLWQDKLERDGIGKRQARLWAYQWLANELGISTDDCHIGMFDIDMCKRVVNICEAMKGVYL